MTCEGAKLRVRCLPRPLPHGAPAALQLFSAQIHKINITEGTLVDVSDIVANKDAPVLEEIFQGLRYDLDVSVTKALERLVVQKLEDFVARKADHSVAMLDRSNCNAGELPCRYAWEGECCSTSSCQDYLAEQCKFNATYCMEYCKATLESAKAAGMDLVQQVVGMFKGASSDLRLAYDDAKRRELIQMTPLLNMSYQSLIGSLADNLKSLPPYLRGNPWAMSLASILEGATETMDTLDFVEIKNLPGVKAVVSLKNMHPFKLLGSIMQDVGLFKLLRQTASESQRNSSPG